MHAFVHGEADEIRAIRRHLLGERGLSRSDMSCSPYWRRTMTDEAWRQVKRDFVAAMDSDVAYRGTSGYRPTCPDEPSGKGTMGAVGATLPGDEFAVSLPFRSEAAKTARTMVGRLLAAHQCPDRLIEDGRLVMHELVVNGVTHGAPGARAEIDVACRVLDEHVLISVLDQGRAGTVAVRASRLPTARTVAASRSWRRSATRGRSTGPTGTRVEPGCPADRQADS